MQFVFLPTDAVLWLIALCLAFGARFVLKRETLRARWRRVFSNPAASASAAILVFFLAIALLDSIHYREALPPVEALPAAEASGDSADADKAEAAAESEFPQAYSPVVKSALDAVILDVLKAAGRERSYSAPFAAREFDKSTVVADGIPVRGRQPLKFAGRRISAGGTAFAAIMKDTLLACIIGGALAVVFWLFTGAAVAHRRGVSFTDGLLALGGRDGTFLWRPAMLVGSILWLIVVWLAFVWPDWHVFGTDAVGNDVLYEAFKSVRTAFAIGTLAAMAALPFAVTLGIAAGYCRGRVDDVVQYIYTTISSIPSVLLIAASVLMATVFLDKHPDYYQTSLERADLKLLLLAVIIGMTGWATLARLLRAETMKISTLDFVSAAKALGVSNARICIRHVLPNVLHIVLIVMVLDFSGIVLYEAVLSYVGVGVDPAMHSFGTMINAARSELSRSPAIWWNLSASFLFLLSIVLPANLLASAVREAFDPKAAPRLSAKRPFGAGSGSKSGTNGVGAKQKKTNAEAPAEAARIRIGAEKPAARKARRGSRR